MAEPPADHLSTISSHAKNLIETLTLQYLPYESGYIGLLGTSAQTISTPGGRTLAAQSHNYYMLTSALPINYLHWLEPDDTHILIEGGPVEYYVFHSSSSSSLPTSRSSSPTCQKFILGKSFQKGEVPIISVPGGCWKALHLCDGVEYALMANVLSPEFTADRVKIGFESEGEMESWAAKYEGKQEWATEKFLSGLVGGNTGCDSSEYRREGAREEEAAE